MKHKNNQHRKQANVALLDIDNVLFDFRNQHMEFLKTKSVFPESFFRDFEEKKYPYVYDFLFVSQCSNIDKYRKTFLDIYREASKGITQDLFKKRLEGKINYSDFDLNLRSSFYASIDEFASSEFFVKGQIQEISELNKLVKQQGEDFFNIGITKRGAGLKNSDPVSYFTRVMTTNYWKSINKTYLHKIYFEGKKINALKDIEKDFSGRNINFMYFIEDDPSNVEDMLINGIKVILIKYDSALNNDLYKRLPRKYSNLKIAADHKEAKELALRILLNF